MENTMKMYVTADEVAQILGVSRGYAYKIIRDLNVNDGAEQIDTIIGKVKEQELVERQARQYQRSYGTR